mmetsp:Transcript_51845/g.139799  ORF Transcript_51845/g.139799 Transcript_51845/m.139799 type:complete len:203 (-) Transcript_51845:352-960(-)
MEKSDLVLQAQRREELLRPTVGGLPRPRGVLGQRRESALRLARGPGVGVAGRALPQRHARPAQVVVVAVVAAVVLVARGVAVCPDVALLEALEAWQAATLRLAAIALARAPAAVPRLARQPLLREFALAAAARGLAGLQQNRLEALDKNHRVRQLPHLLGLPGQLRVLRLEPGDVLRQRGRRGRLGGGLGGLGRRVRGDRLE